MSAGTYAQNFDGLGSASSTWTNNLTLPGWYSAKAGADSTNIVASAGASSTGGLYNFGTNGVNPASDRALGTLASGTATPLAFGVRLVNNTAFVQTNITISYTGEEWRNGASTNVQGLEFSYALSGSPITNISTGNWTNFPALNFNSPVVMNVSVSLDGNIATNRVVIANVVLSGVVVQPGQELFLRWYDTDSPGFDDGLAIDDLTISFGSNAPPASTPPFIITQPQDVSVATGSAASFNVVVSGAAPFSYQWLSNNIAISGATNDTFVLSSVATNISGSFYSVTVTNIAGFTNSAGAMLTVLPPSDAITYMTYNLKGNGTTNWSTNTLQAQAIGRQLLYLRPDVISFNEIPHNFTNEMTNWVTAFLPGYNLVVSPGTDGFIHSGIATRFAIARAQSWIDGVSLNAFGYNGFMARDLFEAEIVVPGFAQHLHAFVAHLKATTSGGQSDADKRAAEASCVSNFFVNTFLAGTNKLHPYILSGDMNEDVFRPETNTYTSGQPIQRLTSLPTSLRLTTPTNIYDLSVSNDMTESIQATRLTVRFDYIMPCTLLYSNITASQIFRTDKLPPPLPPNLFSNDDKVASDHLPVLMTFANPFTKPFKLTAITRSNPAVSLQWDSVPGGVYQVENSSNLATWTALATNITATNYSQSYSTNNLTAPVRFFRVRRPS